MNNYIQSASQLDLFITTPEQPKKTVAVETVDAKAYEHIADRVINSSPNPKYSDHPDPDYYEKLLNNKLIVIDMGAGSATFYDGGLTDIQIEEIRASKGKRKNCPIFDELKKKYKLTYKGLLELPSLFPGHAIVGEDSHLGVPEGESLSQPFSEEKLLKFYESCKENNCALRLFPQKQTPKALKKFWQVLDENKGEYSDGFKDDYTDPIALRAYLLENKNKLTLKKPKDSFEVPLSLKEGHEFTKCSNKILNIHRKTYKNGSLMGDIIVQLVPEIMNHRFIDVNGDRKDYTEQVLSALNLLTIEQYKERGGNKAGLKCAFRTTNRLGLKKGDVHRNNVLTCQILPTLLMCFIGEVKLDEEGDKYVKDTPRLIGENKDRLPSWKWAKKHFLRNSPHRHKAGVASSNLKHWGLKPFVRKKYEEETASRLPKYLAEFSDSQHQFFRETRTLFNHKIAKLVFNYLRQWAIKKYNL
tara:strand:- start:4289 stop:5701 length:1413 start_codon:yes stop_codon:yes gene_type:complete